MSLNEGGELPNIYNKHINFYYMSSSKKNNRAKDRLELKSEGEDAFGKIQENKQLKGKFDKKAFLELGVELSAKQNELYKTIRNTTFTIVQGPAGTAKTFVACYTALGLLADKKISKIIITKPIVEAGEQIGYLPGTQDEKVAPYMKSYKSTFEKILGKFLSDVLFASGVIEINLLAFMRGDTFDDCLMILDEAQNLQMSQAMLWITRLGRDSKAIMLGDVSQYDIKKRDAKFLNFIKICEGMQGVENFKFDNADIVRNKFLIELTERYEKWKYSNEGGDEKYLKS